MEKIGFSLLGDPEIRKPSKLRLAFIILFIFLLILSIVFITLYVVDKTKSGSSGHTQTKESETKTTLTPKSTLTGRTQTKESETKTTLTPKPTLTGRTQTQQSETETSLTPKPKPLSPTTSNTCVSSTCVVSAANILNKLNQSTSPCDDFYEFSCGGFLKKTHLEEDDYLKGGDTAAAENILYSLKDILENEKVVSEYSQDLNSAVDKAVKFYKSCMDESWIDVNGNTPILDMIKKYGSWSITDTLWNEDSWSLEKTLARMAVDLNTNSFLLLNIRSSPFDTSQVYITITEGLSARDRSLTDDNKKRPSRPTAEGFDDFGIFDSHNHYKTFMTSVFKLLGAETTYLNTLDDEVRKIDELENDFATKRNFHQPEPENLRKSMKFMTLNKLNAFTSFKFDWTQYLKEAFRDTGKSIRSDTTVMMIKPDVTKDIIDFITSQPKRVVANAMMWNAIRGLIEMLPKSFRDAYDLYRKNKYKMKPTERWKTCTALTNKAFTYVTTLLYVNEHVSDDALKTASEMFNEIKNQFIDGLKEQKWMDGATRAQARLKLKRMKENIGYPSFIKNRIKLNKYYENVDVNELELLKNQLSSFRVEGLRKLDALGKPPDDGKFYFSPLVVNAYYNPQVNGMTILAGILQPPFYVHGRLSAMNYGSLGMVVGHEITHGFDKKGSQYDEKGNIRSWWTTRSHENFVERSTCLVNQYNEINVYGVQVNGERTLSENIADNGGLKYAFRAYQKWRAIHGNEDKLPSLPFDNNQLFFISFAQSWCEKYRKDKVRILMDFDTHSLDPVRVRVPLHNFPEFSKAFGCTPPASYDTCAVW